MRMHFAVVPVFEGHEAGEDLNRFLAGNRVASVECQFIANGAESAWAICVQYLGEQTEVPASIKGRIDYRKVLPAAEFDLYARLRALRKDISEREGVPPYALFTNEQLAAMVRGRIRTPAALGEIDGVGPGRVGKYGDAFLAVLRDASPESPADDAARVTNASSGPSARTVR